MNRGINGFLKNFSYSLTSQLTHIVISVLIIAIVPKVLGIQEYANWQLYVFYTSYIGLFHLGWVDGIYLRYGGKVYSTLDKDLFHSQFWLLVTLEASFSLFIVFSTLFVNDPGKKFIMLMASICMVLATPLTMLSYIMQATNRIKDYAKAIMAERIVYCLIILGLIASGERRYQVMIIADLAAKFAALIFAISLCKEVVIGKIASFAKGIREAFQNISVGVKLTLSYYAGALIVGIVRYSIERVWDISTFGKISFSLSIANLMLVFINAVSIVLFPMLRRTAQDQLPKMYGLMHTGLIVPLAGLLLMYYPAKAILGVWLPQYNESLRYLALLFPVCLFEAKMSMLVNTFLKTMRKEKSMLLANCVSLVLSACSTLVCVFLLKQLIVAMVSIVCLLAFRCIFAELLLARVLKTHPLKDILREIALALVFMAASWFLNTWQSVALYLLCYVAYLYSKRKEIVAILQLARTFKRKPISEVKCAHP